MNRATKILAPALFVLLQLGAANGAPAPGTIEDVAKPVSTLGAFAKSGGRLAFVRTTIVPYASQWGFVFMINRRLGENIRESSFERWLDNITTLPEIPDGDSWVTNFIGHPLMGATFYAFYKDRGYSGRISVAGAFLQSTLFEYTVEGWKKPPSGVDLIVTPLIGSAIGSKVGMHSFLLSSSYAVSKYILGLF